MPEQAYAHKHTHQLEHIQILTHTLMQDTGTHSHSDRVKDPTYLHCHMPFVWSDFARTLIHTLT